jgi:hypothetical protein
MCACMHACVRVCMRECVHAGVLACMRACMRACVHACIHALIILSSVVNHTKHLAPCTHCQGLLGTSSWFQCDTHFIDLYYHLLVLRNTHHLLLACFSCLSRCTAVLSTQQVPWLSRMAGTTAHEWVENNRTRVYTSAELEFVGLASMAEACLFVDVLCRLLANVIAFWSSLTPCHTPLTHA